MWNALARTLVVLCIAACGAGASARRVGESESESESESGCVLVDASGPVPSLLVESEVPPPPPPPGVIVLDELDAYGPLHVMRIDASGHATDLGLGSSPRMIDATTFGYLEPAGAATATAFVRVAGDGTVSRAPGGNGRLPGLGGPLSPRRSPFTRDGRFMVEADLEGDQTRDFRIFDRYPNWADIEPVDRIPFPDARWWPSFIALSPDGTRLAACGESSVFSFDRATRASASLRITGTCRAFAPDLGAVLLVPADVASPGLRVVDLGTGAARDVDTAARVGAAAFDACASSAVVLFVDDTRQRIDRVFFDGGAPVTLFEGPTTGTYMVELEVDARGWVLAVGEDDDYQRGPSFAWILPLVGGEVTAVPIDTGDRVFEVTLGP